MKALISFVFLFSLNLWGRDFIQASIGLSTATNFEQKEESLIMNYRNLNISFLNQKRSYENQAFNDKIFGIGYTFHQKKNSFNLSIKNGSSNIILPKQVISVNHTRAINNKSFGITASEVSYSTSNITKYSPNLTHYFRNSLINYYSLQINYTQAEEENLFNFKVLLNTNIKSINISLYYSQGEDNIEEDLSSSYTLRGAEMRYLNFFLIYTQTDYSTPFSNQIEDYKAGYRWNF
jgi:hypothetical protein